MMLQPSPLAIPGLGPGITLRPQRDGRVKPGHDETGQVGSDQEPADMPITDISVTDIAAFADGYEFGAAGAYVRIKGVARGTLDPAAPANAGIVDLDQAPRNANGLVDYATDFAILRPKNPLRATSLPAYDLPHPP